MEGKIRVKVGKGTPDEGTSQNKSIKRYVQEPRVKEGVDNGANLIEPLTFVTLPLWLLDDSDVRLY